MKSNEVPERKLIDEKYKWNLELIYKSFEDWQKNFDEIQSKIDNLKNYSGRLGEGSKTLLSFIKDDEAVSTIKFMGKNTKKYLNSEKIK